MFLPFVENSLTILEPLDFDRTQVKNHCPREERARGDMIEVFKWVKGINKGNIDQVLETST